MAKTIDINEYVGTTFYTINRIVEEGGKNAGDALILYFKYIEKVRLDATNHPWATDSYMMKGLGWGEKKFIKAKAILKKLGLIEKVQNNSNGKFDKVYIKVNFIINDTDKFKEDEYTATLLQHGAATAGSDKGGTNALSNEESAGSNEIKYLSKDKCETSFAPNSQVDVESKLDDDAGSSEADKTDASIDCKQAVPQFLTYEECYKNYYKKNGSKYSEKKCRKAFDNLELDEEKSKSLLLDFKFSKWELKLGIKDIMYRPKFETYISSFSFDNLDFQNRENKILECLFKISKEDRKLFNKYKQGMINDFGPWFELDYRTYFKERNRVVIDLK